MAGELTFEFDEITVKNIETRLGAMRAKAPTVLKNALNRTARDARKDLATKARQTYTAKMGGFNSQMKIIPANTGNLVAVIQTRGEHLEFKYFSVQGGRNGAPFSVLINRTHGGRKHLDRAFVNNIARRGQTRKRSTAKGAAGSSVTAVRAARRQGKSRLKINKLFSVSVPQMIGNERDVYGVVEPRIMDNLRKNVDIQIAKFI